MSARTIGYTEFMIIITMTVYDLQAFPSHPLTVGDMCIAKLDEATLCRAEVYNFLSSKTFGRQAE